MHLNDLSNTQLLLLAILVSFITSITTGIATVTLVDDSPEPVVQTISRIIERTVEKVEEVVPREIKGNDQTKRQQVITKETTIVVKEEDLITEAIAKNTQSIVRIYEQNESSASSTAGFLGLGIIVNGNGMVMSDLSIVNTIDESRTYKGKLVSGEEIELELLNKDEENSLVFLQLVDIGQVDDEAFRIAVFADPWSLKLGQSVMSIGGRSYNIVGSGIISGLVRLSMAENNNLFKESDSSIDATDTVGIAVVDDTTDADSDTDRQDDRVSSITTTLPASQILPGAPIFNIFGEVVAVAVLSKKGEDFFDFFTINDIDGILATLADGEGDGDSLAPGAGASPQTAGVKNSLR